MKVLVTGPDGLLGSNLVRDLLEKGHSVRVAVQPGSKSATLDGLDIEKVPCDLLGDAKPIAEAVSGCEGVFHCAAITDMWADSDFTWKVNYDGTKKVLDACIAADVKRLVFIGSGSSFQFGTLENPGDETAPFPEAYRGIAYMESKHKATHMVIDAAKEGKIEGVVVAPTFMFGAYDSRPSSGELIQQFINKRLKVTSPGGRNFAHVKDVANAAGNALDRGRSGEIYLLGGANLNYVEFFDKLAKVANMDAPKYVLPKAVILSAGAAGSLYEKVLRKKPLINYQIARSSILRTYYTPAKAIKELEMPQTPIEHAIEDSIECLKSHGHIK